MVRSPPEFLDTELPIMQRQSAAVSEPIWKILFFPRPSGCNVGETSKPFGSHLLLESASAVACQLHKLSTETLRSEWKDNDVHQPPRCAPQNMLWHGRRQASVPMGGSLRAVASELRRNVRFGALGAFGQFALFQSSCPGGHRAYRQKPTPRERLTYGAHELILGGSATAFNILNLVASNYVPGDGIIVVGDFNSSPDSDVIRELSTHLNKAKSSQRALQGACFA